jgi:hypothetical protein
MPKKELVKNDLVTLRVDTEEPLKAVGEIASETLDTIEKTLDVLEDGVQHVETIVRNNPLVLAGVAVVCLGVGGYVGYRVATKRAQAKFEALLEEEVLAAKAFYKRVNKVDEFETPESAVAALVPNEVVEAMDSYQGKDGKVAYNRVTRVSDEEADELEDAVVQHNVFDAAVTDPTAWDYQHEVALRESQPDKPYVISFEEFHENEVNHDQETMTYYRGDDTLSDSKDKAIDDTEYTVGDDNLLRFGAGSHDANVVYVRNEKISQDFEIILSEGQYQVDVLGMEPPDELRHSARRLPRQAWRQSE